MGRPQKKGIDRFSMSVDFFSKNVILALRGEFGLKGEISLLKILCNTFKCGYYLKWNKSVQLRLLGELPGISAELLQQIVQRLVKWHYFDSKSFYRHKILTNQDIQREYFRIAKRRQMLQPLPYLLIIADNNSVSVNKNPIIADNNSESADFSPSPPITPSTYKEKKIPPLGGIKKKKIERKGVEKEKSCAKKEKEFVPPTLDQVEDYCRQQQITIDPKRFLCYYSAVGWVTGNNVKITDWRAKIEEWMIKENGNTNGQKKTCNRNTDPQRNTEYPERVSQWSGSDI